PATAATSLRLRGYGRGLLLRHLLGNSLWRATGTAWTPLPASLATTAPPPVLGLRRAGRDAPEKRMDRGADLLLHHVADHRHQTSLSRHRFLPLRSPDTRKGDQRQSESYYDSVCSGRGRTPRFEERLGGVEEQQGLRT